MLIYTGSVLIGLVELDGNKKHYGAHPITGLVTALVNYRSPKGEPNGRPSIKMRINTFFYEKEEAQTDCRFECLHVWLNSTQIQKKFASSFHAMFRGSTAAKGLWASALPQRKPWQLSHAMLILLIGESGHQRIGEWIWSDRTSNQTANLEISLFQRTGLQLASFDFAENLISRETSVSNECIIDTDVRKKVLLIARARFQEKGLVRKWFVKRYCIPTEAFEAEWQIMVVLYLPFLSEFAHSQLLPPIDAPLSIKEFITWICSCTVHMRTSNARWRAEYVLLGHFIAQY